MNNKIQKIENEIEQHKLLIKRLRAKRRLAIIESQIQDAKQGVSHDK